MTVVHGRASEQAGALGVLRGPVDHPIPQAVNMAPGTGAEPRLKDPGG